MGRWRLALGTLAGLLASPACSSQVFHCVDDAACQSGGAAGRCEPEGFCSFPSEDCESGFSFGDLAGGGLAGECVEPGTADGSGSGGPGPSATSVGEATGSDGAATFADGTSTVALDGSDAGSSSTGDPPAAWYDCGFTTRHRLELTGVQSGTSLSGYEVLVTLTPERVDLDAIAPDGADLCFVTSDGATMPWELDGSIPGEVATIWVTVPVVEPGADFYLYSGGESDLCVRPPIWADNDYAGVYHLGENVVDASPQDHQPIEVTALLAAGVIHEAREYSDDTHRILIPAADGLTGIFAGGGTVTAWLSPTTDVGEHRIVERSRSPNGQDGWIFEYVDGMLELRRGGTMVDGRWSSDVPLALDTWQHVAVVFDDEDSAAGPQFWIDGVPTGVLEVVALEGDPELDATLETQFGRAPPAAANLEGRLDELRISTVARSGPWIEHQVLGDSDALLEYGPPEASPCP